MKRSLLLPILYQKDLLEIICILERGEKHHSYKIIRNRNHFSLIAKFPARNGEQTPLKKNAYVQQTASHQEKKRVSSEDKLNRRKRGKKESSSHASGIKPASQHTDKKLDDSSDVRLAEQPKLKKKKPPAQVAMDLTRRKAFWKRTKVAKKLSTENWAAHYARLQETKSVASPEVPVVSHPEKSGACLESTHFVSETTKVASPQVSVDSHPVNSGACLEPTFLDSEPNRHLTVEEGTVNTAKLNKLCADEAESKQSDSYIDSPSACGNCLKEGSNSFHGVPVANTCDIVLRTAKLKIGLRTNYCAELFKHYPA